jgi:hypothetical protein
MSKWEKCSKEFSKQLEIEGDYLKSLDELLGEALPDKFMKIIFGSATRISRDGQKNKHFLRNLSYEFRDYVFNNPKVENVLGKKVRNLMKKSNTASGKKGELISDALGMCENVTVEGDDDGSDSSFGCDKDNTNPHGRGKQLPGKQLRLHRGKEVRDIRKSIPHGRGKQLPLHRGKHFGEKDDLESSDDNSSHDDNSDHGSKESDKLLTTSLPSGEQANQKSIPQGRGKQLPEDDLDDSHDKDSKDDDSDHDSGESVKLSTTSPSHGERAFSGNFFSLTSGKHLVSKLK